MLYWVIIGILIAAIIAVIFFTISKLLKEKKDYNQFERRYHSEDDYDDDYDDEYDDYDEYDEEDEDDKGSTRKKLFGGSKKYDDDADDDDTSVKSTDKPKFGGKKVVPIKPAGSRGLEVVVIRPESMEDASDITDTLLSGKAVVLNLEGIHVEVAQRVIDYSAGSCYAMRGNLQKITSYIFLVTPPNVDISGDIPELVAGGIDLSSFKN